MKCPKCDGYGFSRKELSQFVPVTNPYVTIHPYKLVCADCRYEDHGYTESETPKEYADSVAARIKEKA